jgi:large subunit ribosomal protein L10
MAVTRQKKEESLGKLEKILTDATTAVFVNFHGLTVHDVSEVRKTLKGDNVSYTVAKKTLIKKALPKSGAKGDVPALLGEVAIAHINGDSTDVTAPARGIFTFVKKFENRIAILGGIFAGKFLNREEMLEIATIPSQHTLRGMFVNVINAPIQGFVVALQAIADKKVN